jgi:hypothetical protein
MSCTCAVSSPSELTIGGSSLVALHALNGIRHCRRYRRSHCTDPLRRRPAPRSPARAVVGTSCARLQTYSSGFSLRWRRRRLITRWSECWRALLENGKFAAAVARAASLYARAKHHQIRCEAYALVTIVARKSRRVARPRAGEAGARKPAVVAACREQNRSSTLTNQKRR